MNEASVVIIYHKGNILALKRSDDSESFPGFWNFPGGSIEEGESPVEAAVREVKEEASIDIDPAKMESMGSFDFAFLKVHYFKTDKFDGEIEINDESSGHAWIQPEQILDMVFLPMPSLLLGKVIKR